MEVVFRKSSVLCCLTSRKIFVEEMPLDEVDGRHYIFQVFFARHVLILGEGKNEFLIFSAKLAPLVFYLEFYVKSIIAFAIVVVACFAGNYHLLFT